MDATDRPLGAGSYARSTVSDDRSSYQPSLASNAERPRSREKGEHVTEDKDAIELSSSSSSSKRKSGKGEDNIQDGKDGMPNGGFWAWMQVLGSFFLMFNSW
jgi:hypothetical protein